MNISQLIDELTVMRITHGDVEVVSSFGRAEWNPGPVVLKRQIKAIQVRLGTEKGLGTPETYIWEGLLGPNNLSAANREDLAINPERTVILIR